MTLTKIATQDVVTATRETGVREALEMMDDNDVGSVVIVEDDRPVGIVTDRMIAMGLRDVDAIGDVTVADVMTEDLVTIGEDAVHFDALQTMSEEAIRRLPIVDDEGTLVGIITLDDLLVMTAAELSDASDIISQQASPL